MSAWKEIGKGTLGVATGALAVLVALRIADGRRVDAIWRRLEDEPGPGGTFEPAMIADLPAPARRYFLHAIRPGAPLASRLHWQYTGTMKPGQEMPEMSLRADQIIAIRTGFVWKVAAHRGPLLVTGSDYYLDGASRMRIDLLGLVPVVNATGPDIARSALGRLLVECIAIPTAMLPGPHVRIEAVDESHFRAIVDQAGEETPITVTVDVKGRPTELVMPRWGDQTDDGHFESIPYGAVFEDERTFGDYTIPTRIRVAWWYGTARSREQIRLEVHGAELW